MLKAFSACNEIIMCFFFFQFVNMMDFIDRYSYVKLFLDFWDEIYLIIMDDFVMCSWIWVVSILLSIVT